MALSVTNIGSNTGVAVSTVAVTVPAGGVPAGALVVVCVADNSVAGTGGLNAVADTGGNTYKVAVQANNNGAAANGCGIMWTAQVQNALVNTNTITYTLGTATSSAAVSAFYISGAPTLVEAAASATGSSAAPSVTSGTPSVAGDLFVAMVSGTTLIASFTQDGTDAAWVSPPGQVSIAAPPLGGGNVVNAGAGTMKYAPAFGTSDTWAALIMGVQASAPPDGQAWQPPRPSPRTARGAVLRGVDGVEGPYRYVLPNPNVIFLTATGAGTWVPPIDWNPGANIIEVIGGGGAGQASNNTIGNANGGGGGGYSKIINLSTLTIGVAVHYTVGVGGTTVGATGGDSWFNGTTLAGSSVGAKGGGGATTGTGGSGGAAASGIGTFKFSGGGGAGPVVSGGGGGTGGGGAAGPWGNGGSSGQCGSSSDGGTGGGGSGSGGGWGGHGSAASNSATGTVGGSSSNNVAGGALSTAGTLGSGGGGASSSGAGGNGGPGADWTQTSNGAVGGPGGGGGGSGPGSGAATQPGNGGLYGGGGGGSGGTIDTHFGTGAQGIVVISYIPLYSIGFDNLVTQQLMYSRSFISQRYAGMKGRTEFAVYSPFVPMGWEVQPWQPPSSPTCRLRSAALSQREDGIESPFVFVPPVAAVTFGFDPSWFGTRKVTKSVDFSWNIDAPLLGFQPAGWEIAPPQPPTYPRSGNRTAALSQWEDGIEAKFVFVPAATVTWAMDAPAFHVKRPVRAIDPQANIDAPLINFYPAGWEVQPPQPPHRVNRLPAMLRGDDGTAATLIQFLAAGWEVAPPQPPHPRPERSGALMLGDPGNELPYVFVSPTPVPDGWEVAPALAYHVRPERAGALMRGHDGTDAQFVRFFPAGWEVASVQPPFRLNRLPAMLRGDDGAEAMFVNWLNYGWSVQDPQPPHLRSERSGAVARGDDGIEAPYVFVPPFFTSWGYEHQPFPWVRPRRDPSWRGDDGVQGQFVRWFNGGWEVQPPQPPHPRPERTASIMFGNAGIEALYIFVPPGFMPDGWEVLPALAYHVRFDRGAALMRGHDGTDAAFIRWLNAGWEVQPFQPPHRAPEVKAASFLRGDDGTQAVFIRWYNAGWEIQPFQPPHRAPEAKAASWLRGDDGIEALYVLWYNAGWEVQPWQPPHPRPEKWAAIAVGDLQPYNLFTFVPRLFLDPNFVTWPQARVQITTSPLRRAFETYGQPRTQTTTKTQ